MSEPFQKFPIFSRFCILTNLLVFVFLCSCSLENDEEKLSVDFDGHFGQIEIGGKFVGVEFHRSRPLPSRISFYYPVANSIDLSTDYWQRDQSLPLVLTIKSSNGIDSLGIRPQSYRYTPYHIQFNEPEENIEITYTYDVCEDLPVLVLKLRLVNTGNQTQRISLYSALAVNLRTSHSYQTVDTAQVFYINNHSSAIATFDRQDTDSSAIFIANAGLLPVENHSTQQKMMKNPKLSFDYICQFDPGEEVEIIQLIGSCYSGETKTLIDKVIHSWKKSIADNRDRILNFTFNQSIFNLNDSALQQTVYWSKAVLASNLHYIDHSFLPMPCPAEYNFFFTHDLLLTSLGAVNFNPDYVRDGLKFVSSLTQPDSVLAHAYYWKDDRYVTEYCNSDNWNNLWFIIVASSYLKHSNDLQTVKSVFPVIYKSLRMMLHNKSHDDLMNAKRPDWWDIGNIYGPKVYITALMSKALVDYVYIASVLGVDHQSLVGFLTLSQKMQKQMVESFWNDKEQFLFSMMANHTIDKHYYAGSLLATYYGNLNAERRSGLLKKAKEILLDPYIGLRNAMPPDFDQLISAYKFSGLECGLPYVYFNGGVWPHNNAWYALALLSDNQVNQAKNVLKKYMSLEGIRNSPNGQPSFYEYRRTDSLSNRYGEIDKPTFLWAGGWYLNVLYQLAGIRENSWNISFSPVLPDGFDYIEYDLAFMGLPCRVHWQGTGDYFRRIEGDGAMVNSAVMYTPMKHLVLERGIPESPYLTKANVIIDQVEFLAVEKSLHIRFRGFPGQNAELEFISPDPVSNVILNESIYPEHSYSLETGQIYRYTIRIGSLLTNNQLLILF